MLLPTPAGETVRLQDIQGELTLVLFWNPESSFCIRMLDDLKAWQADASPGAPRLVVISTGRDGENGAMALHSQVLLDPGFVAGRAFRVAGTPSAVLVDAEGRIASEVAIGAPAVLALAGAKTRLTSSTARGA